MAEETAHLIVKADTTQVENASRKLGDFATQGKKAEGAASGFSSATNVMANSVKVLAAAFASLKILEYAKEAAMLSARYESLGTVMATVGKNSGYTAQQMEATAQALQKTGISMIGSREQVLKLVQSHIDLAHATKLARIAQDAAVIANVNSTEAFDRMLHGIRSGQTENLRTLGLNVTLENSYKKYAQALGVSTEALDQTQKVQAVLNAVMKEGETIAGAYEAAMGTAGKMINSTERYVENLKVKLGGLFDGATLTSVTAYTDLLKELDKQTDSMAASGELKDWAHRIAIEFAFLADITRVFAGQAKILFNMLATGFGQIKSGNFAGLTATFMNADEALKALYADGEKYQDQVNKRVISEGMLTEKVTGHSNVLKNNGDLQDEIAEKMRKAQELTVSMASKQDVYNKKVAELKELKPYLSVEVYNRALKKAHDELTVGTSRTKAYNVEVYKLKEAEKELAGARDIEYQKLKRHEALLNEARQLTEQTRTAQEKYNDTINRYNTLRPQLTAETYSRAVANATNELERSRSEVNKLDQASKLSSENWRHAWSNMEQTGRMAFTQFAAHGISAMESIGEALKLAVFDLLYHLTMRKWIINIGTSIEGALFGSVGGGITSAAGGSLFSGGATIAKGFGRSLLSSSGSIVEKLGTMFGSSALRSFGVGASGAATAGVFGAGGLPYLAGGSGAAIGGGAAAGSAAASTAEFGAAAGMGARTMAALTNPIGWALLAADIGGRLLAGNKSLKGADQIPVIGGFLAAMFGHAPYKFRQQSLQGNVSMSGFDGDITNVFRSKGGWFVKNRHKSQSEDLSILMQNTINDTLEGFYKSSHKFADNMGLNVDLIDNFNKEVQVKSEKGKQLTDEAVAELFRGIGDSLAENVLPEIEKFKKYGESSFETFSRLNDVFLAVNDAARVLGMTLKDSSDYVKQMGFELRTSFIDAAGGVESFNSKMSFVSENFLTTEQRFAMGLETLNDQLTKAEIPLDTTKESFYQLLRVAAAAGDAVKFGGLLDIAPLFVKIRNSQDEMRIAAEDQMRIAAETASINVKKWIGEREAAALAIEEQRKAAIANELNLSYALLQRSVDAEKLKLTNDYNAAIKTSEERIKGVVDAIAELSDISKLLKTSINSITFTDISAARSQVAAAIASKDFSSPALRDAITALSQKGTGFASKLDEQRYAAQNLMLLRSLDDVADAELLLQERSLSALENAEKILKENYDAEIKRLDGILENAKSQIDALNRIDNSVVSVADAIARLDSAIIAAESIAPMRNNVVSISPSVAAAPVYDSPMRNWNPNAITISPSVSSAPVYDTPLPIAKFELGGKVPRTGIAMLHKDEQVLTSKQNASLEKNLEEMKTAIEVLTITQNKINRRFDKWDGEGLPATRTA